MRRVLVCGGRDYSNEDCLRDVLNKVHSAHPIGTLIQGGARGADALAHKWATENNIPEIVTEYADWAQYGKAAGPIRNERMLYVWKPDLVVAFPGGRGTANMIHLARQAGVPVTRVL